LKKKKTNSDTLNVKFIIKILFIIKNTLATLSYFLKLEIIIFLDRSKTRNNHT